MSSSVTVKQSTGVRVVGLLTLIAGIVLIIAGAITWWTVADQLSAEQITVSEDASFLAGRHVNDPFSAYAQAEVINKHALEASDGMTYAELEQGDPRRDVVMNASFLRASLFTSVVAFGVAALVMGLGVLFILVGWALRRLASGPEVATATAGAPGASGAHSYDDVPSAPAPRHQSPPAAVNRSSDTTPSSGGTSTTAGDGAAAAAGTAATSAGTPAMPSTTPGPAPTDPTIPPNTAPGTTPGGVPQETPGNPGTSPTPDERPAGWASPADRVPPVEGTSDGSGTK